MQNSEKHAEPSMEDILASIRKIIAEEPNALKSTVAARETSLAPVAAAVPAAAAAPIAKSETVAVQPKPAMSSRLSDVVRALAPSAVPVGLTSGSAKPLIEDDFADLVEPSVVAKVTASSAAVSEPPAAVPPLRAAWDYTPPAPSSTATALQQSRYISEMLPPSDKHNSSNVMPSDRSSVFSFGADPEQPPERPVMQLATQSIDVPTLSREPSGRVPEARGMAAMPLESAFKAPEAPALDLGAFVPGTTEIVGFTSPRPLPSAIAADFRVADTAKSAVLPVTVKRPELSPDVGPSTTAARAAATSSSGSRPASEPIDAARSALGAFAASLVATVGSANTSAVTPKATLDEQILEMARPMVREWLDAHLPAIVERMLTDEVKQHGAR